MDFKDLLQSLTSLSEATKETSKGKIHTADAGGYGRKFDTDEEGDEKKAAAPVVKRGKGRPKKGSDDSGEVKKYDSKGIGAVFGAGKAPKKAVGKTSVKHKLKDWIEHIENDQLMNENQITIKPMTGASQIIGADGKPIGTADQSTANVIKQAADKGTLNLADGGQDQQMNELKKSTVKSYVGNKMSAQPAKHTDQVRRDLESLLRAHALLSGVKPTSETQDLPGAQDKLDVAPPKGKLTSADFAALRAKRGVSESLSFNEMSQEAQDTAQEMLAELQSDIENFVNTGHCSDKLEAFLKVHGHSKKKVADEGIEDRVGFSTPPAINKNPATQNPITTPAFARKQQSQGMPIRSPGEKPFGFMKQISAPTKTFESKDMKDMQLESWEKELNSLLNEGITVSSSTGQQGSPDSVSVNATDADAEQLLQVLRQAGVGVFGGNEPEHSGYGAPLDPDAEGHGTEPEMSPTVVGDGDDMMALIKKMTGIGGDEGHTEPSGALEPASAEEGGDDYEDEEGSSDEESHDSEEGQEEVTDEGNEFSGELAKAKAQHKDHFNVDGKEYPVKEEGMQGHQHEDDAENCNECGYTMEQCGCEHEGEEQVEEGFANEPDEEMMKLKALLGMGNDLNRPKRSQTVGNPTRVAFESQTLGDWKKLSGIK